MILFYVFFTFFVDMTKTNRRFIVCTTEQKKLTVLVTIFFFIVLAVIDFCAFSSIKKRGQQQHKIENCFQFITSLNQQFS